MAMRTTFTRNGSAVATTPDGLVALSADEFPTNYINGNRVALIGKQQENLIQADNKNPSSVNHITVLRAPTIDIVNDAAALEAAGLIDICPGNVYKITADPTRESYVFFAGGAKTTGPKSASIYSRGRGTLAVQDAGSQTWVPFDNTSYSRVISVVDGTDLGSITMVMNPGEIAYIIAMQVEIGELVTSPIIGTSGAKVRAADFFDAPGALNADAYGSGLHTWRNAVRMSRDPGEPTIIGSAEHRIYAANGRLHLDGPGELIQPEGEHAPGDDVPFIWNVQFPGAAPDFTLGREYGDANWWNGHLVDIVPFPRKLTAAEINAWVGA